MEKYTQNARQAIMDCQNIAIAEGHQMLDGEHLHLALVTQRDGLIGKLLNYMNVDVQTVINELESELGRIPKVSGGADSMYASRRFNQLIMTAEKNAEQLMLLMTNL